MINGDGILLDGPSPIAGQRHGLIPQHCSLKRTVGIGVRAGRKIQLKLIEIYRLSVEVGQRKGDALIPTRGIQLANVKRKAAFLKVIVLFRHIGFGGLFVCGGYRWRLLIGWGFRLCVFG